MLSIAPLRGDGANYYIELAREDFYENGGEAPGRWYGSGAQRLGLLPPRRAPSVAGAPATNSASAVAPEGEHEPTRNSQGESQPELLPVSSIPRQTCASDVVQNEDFRRVFEGYAPLLGNRDDGEPLVRSAGTQWHRSGWDLTFSAPKSVSTLWSQSDETTRAIIESCHREAVQSALDYLETEAVRVRRGAGGVRLEGGGLVAALFEHGTSRAQNPQIHTHALVLNVAARKTTSQEKGAMRETHRDDPVWWDALPGEPLFERFGALESSPLFDHKMTAGALYRAAFAQSLNRDLGLVPQPTRVGFEIEGVPSGVTKGFSQRNASIKATLDAKGWDTARAAAKVAVSSRQVKEHLARAELFPLWHSQAREGGWGPEAAARLVADRAPHAQTHEAHASSQQSPHIQSPSASSTAPNPPFQKWVHERVWEAAKELTRYDSHFHERDVIRHVAQWHPRWVQAQSQAREKQAREQAGQQAPSRTPSQKSAPEPTMKDLTDAVRHSLGEISHIHRLGRDRADSTIYTTQAIRQMEREVGALAQALRERTPERWEAAFPQEAFRPRRAAAREKEHLSEKAQELSPAVREALGHLIDPDAGDLRLVSGPAGSGLTTLLGVAREHFEAEGRRVWGASTTTSGVQSLEEKGVPSTSIAGLLWDYEMTPPEWRLGELGREVSARERGDELPGGSWGAYRKGKAGARDRAEAPRWDKMGPGDVLLVDGAERLGTRELHHLLDLAHSRGLKLVMGGDPARPSSVEAGGGFASLCGQGPCAHLFDPARPREEWAREAIRRLAQGDAGFALGEHAKRGLVGVEETLPQVREALIRDWSHFGLHRPEMTQIYVSTPEEAAQFNGMAQRARLEGGAIGQGSENGWSGPSSQTIVIKNRGHDTREVEGIFIHDEPREEVGFCFYRGDRIRFGSNSKVFGLKAGDVATIEFFDTLHNTLVARRENGQQAGERVWIPWQHYNDIDLAYALTTSQGAATQTDHAYVLVNGAATNLENSYVQLSRASQSTHLYADRETAGKNLEGLARAMSRSSRKVLAEEVARTVRLDKVDESASTSPVQSAEKNQAQVKDSPAPEADASASQEQKTSPEAERVGRGNGGRGSGVGSASEQTRLEEEERRTPDFSSGVFAGLKTDSQRFGEANIGARATLANAEKTASRGAQAISGLENEWEANRASREFVPPPLPETAPLDTPREPNRVGNERPLSSDQNIEREANREQPALQPETVAVSPSPERDAPVSGWGSNPAQELREHLARQQEEIIQERHRVLEQRERERTLEMERDR